MPKPRNPRPRRRSRSSAHRPPPTANQPVDLVAAAERQQLAKLQARIDAGKGLSAAQRRELAVLQARHVGGGAAVECQVSVADGRPGALVPPGHDVLVALEDQLAEVYAVDRRTVQLWKADPAWPASARGPYLLRGAVPEFIRARRERPAGPNDLHLAQLEYKRLQAENLRQRLAAKVSDAVPREVLTRALELYGRGVDNALQDADETFAGVRSFLHARFARLREELLSVTAEQLGVGR